MQLLITQSNCFMLYQNGIPSKLADLCSKIPLQYVEKLDKIIRFAIKVKTLTLDDLDTIWNAQVLISLYFASVSLGNYHVV